MVERDLDQPPSRDTLNSRSGWFSFRWPEWISFRWPAAGRYDTGEAALAESLWDRIPDNSVTLLDRGFLAYGRLWTLSQGGSNRHWLTRAKSNTRWTTVQNLGLGDDLVELRISRQFRADRPELPELLSARAVRVERRGFKPTWLLTSLTDASRYPASELASLYHERWDIEMAFDEQKTHMLERNEAIRSKTPAGVRQELWGIGIAFNLVRRMMVRAAEHRGVAPRRISFWNALLLVRNFSVMAWNDAPGALPKLLDSLVRDMGLLLLPERRERTYPRSVKIKMSSYNRNTAKRAQPTPQVVGK